MNKAKMREQLAKTDENIKKGEARIGKQEERVKELASDDHAREVAEETFKDFKKLQETMERHRDLMREELKRDGQRLKKLRA
jgi:hypothetical protein